jgi:hypothetical protein
MFAMAPILLLKIQHSGWEMVQREGTIGRLFSFLQQVYLSFIGLVGRLPGLTTGLQNHWPRRLLPRPHPQTSIPSTERTQRPEIENYQVARDRERKGAGKMSGEDMQREVETGGEG